MRREARIWELDGEGGEGRGEVDRRYWRVDSHRHLNVMFMALVGCLDELVEEIVLTRVNIGILNGVRRGKTGVSEALKCSDRLPPQNIQR